MYSDIELIVMARQGNDLAEDELAVRYSKQVRICARPYFLAGGDREDLIQEGMLGLLSAIRKYDPASGTAFKTYAERCIHNRLLSAIENASRQKHTPLNERVSYEDHMRKEDSFAEDTFTRQTEDRVLARVLERELLERKDSILSKMERDVLKQYLAGMSYKEIAQALNKTEKSVDNAVQRIRRKIAEND